MIDTVEKAAAFSVRLAKAIAVVDLKNLYFRLTHTPKGWTIIIGDYTTKVPIEDFENVGYWIIGIIEEFFPVEEKDLEE